MVLLGEWRLMKRIQSFHYSEHSQSTLSSSSNLKEKKKVTVSKNHTFSAQVVFILSVKHWLTSAFRRAGFMAEMIFISSRCEGLVPNVCQTSFASCALSVDSIIYRQSHNIIESCAFTAFILKTYFALHYSISTVCSELQDLDGRPWESCMKIVQLASHIAHWLKQGTWC